MNGKVYLVGAGPGSPGLITVRGLNILKQADIVVHDYLVDNRLLKCAREDAELISSEKLDAMIKNAKKGKKVVRLKAGDSTIFSRCTDELNTLIKEEIEFEIVPGITAASAVSSFTGILLTDRNLSSSVVFVTGRENKDRKESLVDWHSLAKSGTIVLYMAVGTLKDIVQNLISAGKDEDTPCAIAQEITRPTEKFLKGTLGNIVKKARSQKIRPPAIVIIGEVVKLGDRFNWLEKNKRILFTGLSNERFFLEGTYFHLPLIKIEPMGSYKKFDEILRKIKEFDWVVFASRYGVEYFFKRLNKIGYDSRVLGNKKIAAVGNSTKTKLLDFGINADLVPKKESSKGLIGEFSAKGGSASGGKRQDIKGKKIFLPRSNISDKGLTKALEKQGAKVTTGFAYRNVMPKDLPDLDLSFFDEIMFTSPSTVRNFKKRYKKVPKNVKVRCIGDVTLREAKRCGFAR